MSGFLKRVACSMLAAAALAFAASPANAQLAPTVAASPAGYTPGENITINLVFNYTGSETGSNFVKAGFEAVLPAGWGDTLYDGSAIPGSPLVNSFQPTTHTVSVGWIKVAGSSDPGASATIPFTVSVPAGFTGTGNIFLTCLWGSDTKVNASPFPLAVTQSSTLTVTFTAATGGTLTGTTTQTGASGFSTTPVQAVPNTGWSFVNWTLGGTAYSTDNPLTINNVTSNMALQANFTTSYSVVFSASPGGTLTPNDAINQTVERGHDALPINAVPNANMAFVNWTGSLTSTANPLTVTNVTGNMNIQANFQPASGFDYVALAASHGAIGGIDAGPNPVGTPIPITATPSASYAFSGWSADPAGNATFANASSAATTVTLNGNQVNVTITATFVSATPEFHVAPGSVFHVNAADAGVDAFYKKPNVTLDDGTKAKVLNSGKSFKAGVTVLDCQWTTTKEGPGTHSLHVDGTQVTDKFVIEQPTLTALAPNVGATGDPIVVSGKYFGSKCPKLYLTYTDAKGKVKDAKCKVNKPYAFADAKGKGGKSVMDVETGDSLLVFAVPKNITTTTTALFTIEFKFAEPVTAPFNTPVD